MLDIIRSNAQSWGVKVLFGLIVIVFVFWGLGTDNGGNSNVIAFVGEEPITLDEYRQAYENGLARLRQQAPQIDEDTLRQIGFRRQVLEQLVNNKLLLNEADTLGIRIADVDVQQAILDISAFKGIDGRFDEGTYQAALRANGMTPAMFEYQIRQQLLFERLVEYIGSPAIVTEAEARQLFEFGETTMEGEYVLFNIDSFMNAIEIDDATAKTRYEQNTERFAVPETIEISYLQLTPDAVADPASVSDEAVATRYEENKESFRTEEQAKARHILVKVAEDAPEAEVNATLSKIREIASKIEEGLSFEEAAKTYSEGPSSVTGGDLGWFGRGRMVPTFEAAVFELEPGTVSKPVRTPFGWHLILVEEIRPEGIMPLEDVAPQIRVAIAEEKAMDKLTDLMDEAVARVSSGETLEKVGEVLNLPIRQSAPFAKGSTPAGLDMTPGDAASLFALSDGDVVDTPFIIDDGYLLVRKEKTTPASVRPFEAVKPTIVVELKREEATKLARKEAQAALSRLTNSETGDEELVTLADKLKTTMPLRRDGNLGALGFNEIVSTELFSVEKGTWLSETFDAPNGVFIIRAGEKSSPTQEEWEKVKPTWIEMQEQNKKQQLFAAFVGELRKNADVRIENEDILK